MTADLLALSDWLMSHGVTHVAMESIGEYWKPVFNILENDFEVMVVNAQHVSKVPGRKTDHCDAEWLAELMQFGLLKASFIPAVEQRELRELTRYRSTFVRERVNLVNRIQKLLESANPKLTSVALDVMGMSGRAMLEALIVGTASPEEIAELAQGGCARNASSGSKPWQEGSQRTSAACRPSCCARLAAWTRPSLDLTSRSKPIAALLKKRCNDWTPSLV